jgi:ketosteroid isomerase-like protein
MTIGTESGVRALLEVQAEAMRTKDLDRLMSLYSPEIVYFDVVPPLRFVGSAALRDRFARWFSGYRGPIGMEIRYLDISSSGDIAVAHWFSRASGTLQDGREVGFWVRVTSCCRRTDQGWSITHEHVSLPVDLAGGSPAMDLVPD